MEQLELEGIAEAAYREGGLDPERPNVERLARSLLGPSAVQRGARLVSGSPSALVRVGSDWRIVIARTLSREYALHAIGHELGHWLMARHGGDVHDERAADYLGAALLAPRSAFIAAHRALGDDLPALAEAFSTTETGAALRLGEVHRIPLAVISPALVRLRGPEEWVWPDESTLRRWARGRALPGIRKVRLTDDPRRVVLDAEDVSDVGT